MTDSVLRAAVAWLTQPTHQRSADSAQIVWLLPVALVPEGAQLFFGRHKVVGGPHGPVWRAVVLLLGQAPNLQLATTETPSPMAAVSLNSYEPKVADFFVRQILQRRRAPH